MDPSVLQKLFDKKLLGVIVPEEFGGLGLGYVEATKLIEELARISPAVVHSVFVHNMSVDAILRFGNEDQKERYVKMLASGRLGAAMITEPSGGSDVANSVKLRAEKEGVRYVLNGTKTFITNSTHAEVFVVIGRTGEGKRGLTAFIVEKGDGIVVTKMNPSGLRGSDLEQ